MSECTSNCNFCVVHQYGVYVLNAGSLLVFCIILLVYRREVFDWCRGAAPQPKIQTNEVGSAHSVLMQTKTAPIYQPLRTIDASTAQASPIYGPQPVIIQPQSNIPPIIVQSSPPLTPQVITLNQAPQPTRYTVNASTAPGSPIQPKSPPPSSPIKSPQPRKQRELPSQTPVDPFKLPTAPRPGKNPLKVYESTGSDYYKQITKGKKPVASISQYIMKRNQLKKEPKKHHHHHRDKKAGYEKTKNV